MSEQITYKESFWNFIRTKQPPTLEMEVLAKNTDIYPAPYEFFQEFKLALEKENLFRRIATVMHTTTSTGSIYSSASTGEAEWIGEAGDITNSNDNISKFSLQSHKLAGQAKLMSNFVTDYSFDIEGYLSTAFARRFGREEENSFINGDGVNSPTGILHATGGAQVGVTAQASDAITYDEVVKLFFSLDKHYRRNAVWLINDETAFYLRTLKDANGNYLWNHSDNTILGKPVEYSNYMPDIESGKKAIAFGDFSYFWIVVQQDLAVTVLKEKYILQQQIGYLGIERLDARLILPEAIKLLQLA